MASAEVPVPCLIQLLQNSVWPKLSNLILQGTKSAMSEKDCRIGGEMGTRN